MCRLRYREVKQFIKSLMADLDFRPRQPDYIENKLLTVALYCVSTKQCTVVPPSTWFHFLQFQLPLAQNITWKIPEIIHKFEIAYHSEWCDGISCLPALSHLVRESSLCLAYSCCRHYLRVSHLVAI